MESTIVHDSDYGVRFDNVLARVAKISRSQAKVLINNGSAKINGYVAKANQKIQINDSISWIFENFSDEEPQAEEISFDIIYEDEYLLAVNKPPNLVVHPGAGNSSGTLLNGLLFYSDIFSQVERCGIVHRLDKDTSGILIVAKSNHIRDELQRQFKSRTVSKSYLSIVNGRPKNNTHVENNIGRHPTNRKKQMVLNEGGRKAISVIEIEEYFKYSSLVRVNILTGRTHQIRVHLAHIGHSIIGDSLYGKNKRIQILKDEIKRQMLHAYLLKIKHPITKKNLFLKAPIPEDMKNVIQQQRVLN